MLPEDWIAGFIEGEGTFFVGISKVSHGIGYYPIVKFQIYLHEKDKHVLEEICDFFDVGKVRSLSLKRLRDKGINASDQYQYDVWGLDCLVIKEFFEEKPMFSSKKNDFEKWVKIMDLINHGKHLTKEGLLEIAKIRDGMNVSLSQKHPRYRDYSFFVEALK